MEIPKRNEWYKLFLIVLGHLVLMYWAFRLVAQPDNISLLWLPDGFLLGMLLLIDRRLWLPLLLLIVPSTVLYEMFATERTVVTILSLVTANIIETFGAALIYRSIVKERKKFRDFYDLVKFLIVCVLLVPSVSASIGAFIVVSQYEGTKFIHVYRTWMLSAGLGILFLTPLTIYLNEWIKHLNRKLIKEQILLYVFIAMELLIVVALVIFFEQNREAIMVSALLILPMLLFVAIRFGVFGTILFLSVLVIATIQLTAFGYNFLSDDSLTTAEAILSMQIYLFTVVIVSLFTALATENLREVNNDLYQSKQRLQLILDTLPYGIQENTCDGIITYSNLAHHRILGYENGELTGKPVWFALTKKNKQLKNYLAYLIKEIPSPDVYITQNRRKDGSEVWLEVVWNYQYDRNGNVAGFISVISDITKRKQAEDLLKQQVDRNKKILDTTLDGYISGDLDGNIVDVNPAYCHIVGYSYDELKQMNMGDVVVNWSADVAKNRLAEIKKKGGVRYETQHKCKNGQLIDLDVNANMLLQDDKNYVVEFVRDITEQKKLTKELTLAKEKAEESNRLKTEFINNMSHEIRTPMNGIIGFTNLLSDPYTTNEQRQYFTSIIKNSSNQLLRIIDDILEISMLETRNQSLSLETISLNDFFLDIFSLFDHKAKERKIPFYLRNELPHEESFIKTDKTILNKVVSNLVENAIKFTNKGFIELGYYTKESELIIYVKDTGIGVAAKSVDRIFERFSQEDIQIAHSHGGLGLGLSIARENVLLLNGKISLKSEKGVGSTFFVSLPYVPGLKQDIQNEVSPNIENKRSSSTILIAEDEEINFLYLETILGSIGGIKLIHAKNGEEAINYCLSNGNIELVLMDIKMPIINGYEATKRIKAKRPDIPVIAQTAYSTDADKKQAFDHGCNDFIPKPINKTKLIGLVNKYINVQ